MFVIVRLVSIARRRIGSAGELELPAIGYMDRREVIISAVATRCFDDEESGGQPARAKSIDAKQPAARRRWFHGGGEIELSVQSIGNRGRAGGLPGVGRFASPVMIGKLDSPLSLKFARQR
jgi:hypothetical protein